MVLNTKNYDWQKGRVICATNTRSWYLTSSSKGRNRGGSQEEERRTRRDGVWVRAIHKSTLLRQHVISYLFVTSNPFYLLTWHLLQKRKLLCSAQHTAQIKGWYHYSQMTIFQCSNCQKILISWDRKRLEKKSIDFNKFLSIFSSFPLEIRLISHLARCSGAWDLIPFAHSWLLKSRSARNTFL